MVLLQTYGGDLLNAKIIRMESKMEWVEIRETVIELAKRNQQVCKNAPSRRQIAENYLDACLRGITTDCVGPSYGNNRKKFDICHSSLMTNNGELRFTPPNGFEPGKTKNTEYTIKSWEAWLDSIQKKNFWENMRQFFFGH